MNGLTCADGGALGKTALLAHWARSRNQPAAWLALDTTDNDPVRFWRHLMAALDLVRPGIGGKAGRLPDPSASASFDGLASALINHLAAAPADGELLLVIDDYHVIDAWQVHHSLMFLLEHLPPGLRLVLASRSDPPLPLARLRATGQLAELRAGDLRFNAEEAAALLRETIGGNLPAATAAALAERTEGWAAGLRLAALSLHGRADPGSFVAAFSGSHRYVLDYLAGEVLERQNDQVRAFLLETSVLERLSGGLCDAVTGRVGGQAMLEQVERAGLFLIPLDEVRGWWRYHHLFADLLRARLQQQQPGRIALLHRKAAAWCADQGLADDAVGHALAAGDTAWAAQLIERNFDEIFCRHSEVDTIRRWVSALPAEAASSRPRLLLVQALIAAASGDLQVAEPLLDSAERVAGGDAELFEPAAGRAGSKLNVPALISLHRSYLAQLRGDAEGTASSASQALAGLGDDEQLLASLARWNLAVSDWPDGRPAAAEDAFASSVARWRAAGLPTLAGYGTYQLVQVHRAQGRLDAASRACQQALELTAPPGRPALSAAGPVHVGLAEVAYQRGEIDTALREVGEGIALCRRFVCTGPLAAGLVTLAWVRQAMGDHGGALEAIGEARRACPIPAGLLNPVPAEAARLLLAQGEVAAVARWLEARGRRAGDEPSYGQEREYLVLARVLLAQDQPDEAVCLLERLHAAAAAQRRAGDMIEIGALRALALAATGAANAAVAALARVLMLACPLGYASLITPFFMGTVIGAVATGQVPVHPSGNVLAAWASPTAVLTGFLFVAACAYVSAVFLVLEARQRGHKDLVRYFSLRATAAGVLTGALAGGTFAALPASAPYLYARLTGIALPLVAISVAAGIAVLGMLWLRWYHALFLRGTAAIAVATVVCGWGLAQYPYLLPTSLTLATGSAPTGSLVAELVVAGLAVLLVAPGFALLYFLQQRRLLTAAESDAGLRLAARLEPAIPGRPAAAPVPARTRIVTALVLAMVAIRAIRDMFSPSHRR